MNFLRKKSKKEQKKNKKVSTKKSIPILYIKTGWNMSVKYESYKAEDYLIDDYFVETILYPTAESEKFWKSLLRRKKINETEFNAACTILNELRESKPDVSDKRIRMVWRRIIETNRRNELKRRRLRIFRYAAAACFIAAISGISLFTVLKTSDSPQIGSSSEIIYENVINPVPSTGQIQLVADDVVVDVDGSEADIEYDKSGKMKVNREAVALETENVPQKYQLRVPYGKRAFLKMPDGTSLWVNSGSTVTYPSIFAEDKREIFAEGEIYAEVFHDANRPFIVKTNTIEVRVLGTAFNLSAYKEEKQAQVVLVNGTVNVQPEVGTATLLRPNQMYTYTDQVGTVKNVDVESYVSWHSGVYVFRNESVENVLRRLSRYYNVTIKLASSPSGMTCSGKLVLKDDFGQLLKGLSEVAAMNCVVENNEYLINFE